VTPEKSWSMNLLEGIEHVGEDIAKGIEWPFKHAAKLAALIGDGLRDAPAVKHAIIQLVQKAEGLSPDFVAAVTADGLNLGADLKCLVAAQGFFVYFKTTFLPVVEKAYADLKKDMSTPATAGPSSPAPAGDELQPGPGLHNVVPA
jgi:hypothetical protein